MVYGDKLDWEVDGKTLSIYMKQDHDKPLFRVVKSANTTDDRVDFWSKGFYLPNGMFQEAFPLIYNHLKG